MGTIAMAVLTGSVAAGYFTIAVLVAPRIKMPSASGRIVLVIRGAAIAFFVGCGLTHIHILVHTIGLGTPQPVEAHEFVFHVLQAIGAWLFIAGAILRLELHVVPSQGRVGLKAAFEEQRQLTRQAQTRARRDELTGLARRWRFDESLEHAVERARYDDTPSALVLIDVDDLKLVNDTDGHQAGDAVLTYVADAIRLECRTSDVAARIGGDEFAIILFEASPEVAESVARRIVSAVRCGAQPGVLGTSVSAGVAQIQGALSPAAVLSEADVALYDCKRAGGDRHSVSEPATPAVVADV